MERLRKPFQGVWNIVRFNWHYYLLSIGVVLLLLFLRHLFEPQLRIFIVILCAVIVFVNLISITVSYYVYDFSKLYRFPWLEKFVTNQNGSIVNIHAGFDETSELLHAKFPTAKLQVFDFYDSEKHTEVSIRRARKAYPPFPKTEPISTSLIPISDSLSDYTFLIFSAHEIRNDEERVAFFKEISRISNASSKIFVVEHLRDFSNFLAYNIGFFHFLPKLIWLRTFAAADLNVVAEIKINPFVTAYILEKNGTAS